MIIKTWASINISKSVKVALVIMLLAYAAFEIFRTINLQRAYKDYELASNNDDAKAAIEAVDRIMQFDGKNAEGFVNRAYFHVTLNQLGAAVEDHNSALGIDPSCFNALIGRGRISFTLGNFTDTVSDLTKALEIKPIEAFDYRTRGCSLSQLGKMKEAFTDFDKAIELEPKNACNYFARGTAFEKTDNFTSALKDFATTIELSQTLAKASHMVCAGIYEELGDARKAQVEQEAAEHSNTNDSEGSTQFEEQDVLNDYLLTQLKKRGHDLNEVVIVHHLFCVREASLSKLNGMLKDFGLTIESSNKPSKTTKMIVVMASETQRAINIPARTYQLIKSANFISANYCGWSCENRNPHKVM